jgi:hypothetical protein
VTPILKDGKTAIPDAAIESIRKNKIALKGPLAVSEGQNGTGPTHVLTGLPDAHWQGSRFPQPYPPPHIQPLRQPPALPLGRRLQDPVR